VYEEIGSLAFVEKILEAETFKNSAEENTRRVELRAEIEEKREQLKQKFLANLGSPEYKTITCNLVLQSDDLIFKRLAFVGPLSSNVTIDCLGEGDARAQIRNPASVSKLEDVGKDSPMLNFRSTNCGVEPLSEGSTDLVDELGAVKTRCDPVRNVSLTNYRIRGRTDATSIPDEYSRPSMIRTDYVGRLRQSAPQHVTFSRVQMAGRYLEVVHLRPAVHHFTIEDSDILSAFLGISIHLPGDIFIPKLWRTRQHPTLNSAVQPDHQQCL